VFIAAGLFVIAHASFAKKKEAAALAASGAGVPARVPRHGMSARVSHWILAATTFTLLITSFFPIAGIKFPWVTIHWIAGCVFTAYVIYHLVDTLVRKSWGTMWIRGKEVGEAVARTRDFFNRTEDPAKRPGKWGMENKLFHHLTALAGAGALATGILLMARVDTWFWSANPYVFGLADTKWGWIYVLHGASAVSFVGLLIAHIYFALRPDKLWITKSMFRGWITRDEYLGRHNPDRWPVSGPSAPAPPPSAPDRIPVGAGSPNS
jgi:cytochrome b subunit of formate dehydrogenase